MDASENTPDPTENPVLPEAVGPLEDTSGFTRGSFVKRSGVVAGGALLAAPVIGALARPSTALAGAVTPPPPSIGADVPLTYFGPSPSQVQKELVGPLQLLRSGALDLKEETITIPLYKGQLQNGKTVWYVLTDTTDKANSEALGLLHSAKLTTPRLAAPSGRAASRRTRA